MYTSELSTYFYVEAQEMLENAALILVEAEKNGTVTEVLNEVFRTFHSIKGGAQTLHIFLPGKLAHHLESLLSLMRQGKGVNNLKSIDLIFSSIDLLQESLAICSKQGHADELQERFEALINEVDEYLSFIEDVSGAEEERVIVNDSSEEILHLQKLQDHEVNIKLTEKPKDGVAKDFTTLARVSTINRLIHVLCIIDYKASMPQVSQFLTLQRIKELGTVFYNNIEMDVVSTPSAKRQGCFVSAIVATTKTELEIKRECNTADVHAIHITKLSNEIFAMADIPHIAIEDFVLKVVHILNCIRSTEQGENTLTKQHLRSLYTWGEHFVNQYPYFKGGIDEWQRKIKLITKTINIYGSEFGEKCKLSLEYLLKDLWEWFYLSINNKTYFYTIMADSAPSSIAFEGQLRDKLKTDKIRFLFVDLSKINVLEWDDVEALANYFYMLHERKIELLLYAQEPYAKIHAKALAGIKDLVPLLLVYYDPYSAFYKVN